MMPLLFAACGSDDDYYGRPGWSGGGSGGSLNQYEQKLVGSYVSDDDPSSVFYLVLDKDRTGYFKVVTGGQTSGDEFRWSATGNKLTVVYKSDNERVSMDYYYRDNHLYVDGIPLVVNDGSTPEGSDSPLVGQWQGSIDGYYQALLGQQDGNYATVCEFAANGEGAQLDYNIYSPKTDFAYNPFTWTESGGVIVINYVEGSVLPRGIVSDYALSATRFTGRILYGATSFGFAYDATSGFDWSYYINGGSVSAAKSRMKMLRKAKTGALRSGSFAR